MARRRWTFTPRRCAVCRQWLSRSRWRLGLSVCSGECNRKRPGHGLVDLSSILAALNDAAPAGTDRSTRDEGEKP